MEDIYGRWSDTHAKGYSRRGSATYNYRESDILDAFHFFGKDISEEYERRFLKEIK